MKLRSAILGILFAAFSLAATAHDKGPPDGMADGERIMFRRGGIGTIGFVSVDKPSWGIAWLPMNHMMLGAAVGLTFDGNGLVNPVAPLGARLTEKWGTSVLLAAEYMVVDKFPFAMGPQIAGMAVLAPGTAFSYVALMPGWGFWYAPWNAPVAIGSALAVNIEFKKGLNPSFGLVTPMVRLVYVFN